MTYRECSLACVWLIMLASAGQADIFRWDNGQLIPRTPKESRPRPAYNCSA